VTDPARVAHPAVSDGRDPPATGGAYPRGDAESVPEVASAREYLRSGLPSIYREQDSFGMNFLNGLERVLDRQVAIVDSLGAYLSPRLAPPEMVDAIAGWLGLALDDAPTEAVRRELLGSAEQIARLRGTRAGLELVFEICFPGLHLKVRDHGEVALLDGAVPPPSEPYPGFEVHCPVRLEPALRNAVERAIERQRPIQVARRPNTSELVEDASEVIDNAAGGSER
jgi:phage tail-like protein